METEAMSLAVDRQEARSHESAGHLVRDVADPILRMLGHYADVLGLSLLCFDSQSEAVIAQTDSEMLPVLPLNIARQLTCGRGAKVICLPPGVAYFAVPLPDLNDQNIWGIGYVLSRPGVRPSDFVLAAAQNGWSQVRFERWLSTLPFCQPELLKRHLTLVLQEPNQYAREAAARAQVEEMVAGARRRRVRAG